MPRFWSSTTLTLLFLHCRSNSTFLMWKSMCALVDTKLFRGFCQDSSASSYSITTKKHFRCTGSFFSTLACREVSTVPPLQARSESYCGNSPLKESKMTTKSNKLLTYVVCPPSVALSTKRGHWLQAWTNSTRNLSQSRPSRPYSKRLACSIEL